jgi:hypothetical protein
MRPQEACPALTKLFNDTQLKTQRVDSEAASEPTVTPLLSNRMARRYQFTDNPLTCSDINPVPLLAPRCRFVPLVVKKLKSGGARASLGPRIGWRKWQRSVGYKRNSIGFEDRERRLVSSSGSAMARKQYRKRNWLVGFGNGVGEHSIFTSSDGKKLPQGAISRRN